jgi:hypothetical protein
MLAHVEQEPEPPLLSPLGRAGCLSPLQGADCLSPFSPEGVLPPSLISPAIKDLVNYEPSTRMDLDSAVDIHKQPNPEPGALGMYTFILFFISRPAILSFGMLPK